jgi:hypothetical protein
MNFADAIQTLHAHDHEFKRVRRAAWPETVLVRRTLEGERGTFGTYIKVEGKKQTHYLATAEDIDATDWSVTSADGKPIEGAPAPPPPPAETHEKGWGA